MAAFLVMPRPFVFALLAVCALMFLAPGLDAHAILESSNPAIDSVVKSSSVPITLTFNVRVDAPRSRLRLLFPNASLIELSPQQTSPETLTTTVTGLRPGSYTILWQVLAPDGHITRGEIPFKVVTP